MASSLSKGDTSHLADMHATTSGLKSLVSSMTILDIEVARRCMGGHGYSAFSGLGRVYAEYLPSATYAPFFTSLESFLMVLLIDSKAIISSLTNKSYAPPSNHSKTYKTSLLLQIHSPLPPPTSVSSPPPQTLPTQTFPTHHGNKTHPSPYPF